MLFALLLSSAASVTPDNLRAHSHRQRVRIRLQMESCPQQYLQSYIPADPLAVCDQNNMVRGFLRPAVRKPPAQFYRILHVSYEYSAIAQDI